MDDVLNDALSNLEHDNYERSHKGYENRQADIALIRAALAAQSAASAEPSDELIELNARLNCLKQRLPANDAVAIDFFDHVANYARALLSRYGRHAGDAVAADEITYEIWQDDMMVASSTDPKDASHYAAVYSQDGPVKVYTVLRSEWEGPNGGIVRGAGQMPAGDAQPVRWLVTGKCGNDEYTRAADEAQRAKQLRVESYCGEDGTQVVPLYAAPVAAQKADDARDAERYRWLRKGANDEVAVVRGLGAMDYGMSAVVSTYSEEIDGDDLDAAIDAAIAQQRKEGA